jgi:hypothetical protein
LIAPLAYAHSSGGPTFYGVGDIELGAKLRFIVGGAGNLDDCVVFYAAVLFNEGLLELVDHEVGMGVIHAKDEGLLP